MIESVSGVLIYISLFVSLFFEVFLLITYLEKRGTLKKEVFLSDEEYKTVTVIVPCYNEEKTISKTLSSLLKLTYPKNKLKILIVDDGSTDGTQRILNRFRKNKQIEIHKKENGGKYTALNYALEHTTSELVGCLDADSFVVSDALLKITDQFRNPEIMAVTPGVMVDRPSNILQSIQRVEYSWGIFFRKMLSYINAVYVTPGPFSIFRTEVFRKLGGYKHAHNTEDFEIALRMQKNGMKIANVHDAIVLTVTPKKILNLYKQRLRWTYGFLNNLIDYKSLLFNKKYGDIGIYILPAAVFSVFISLYFTATFLWKIGTKTSDYITEINAVGFSSLVPEISFDWFFINTSSVIFLTFVVIALSIVILIISRVITDGKFKFSSDLLYFLFFYPILAPIWLSSAVFNTLLKQKVGWR